MLILFCRCFIIYAAVLTMIRLMGKRQVSELQPFELAMTMLIADIAAGPISDPSAPVLTGIVQIACLVVLQGLTSLLASKSRKFRRALCGTPAVIIENGKVNVNKINEMLLSVDDVIKILRSGGCSDINKIKYAVVETGGDITAVNTDDDLIVTLMENGRRVKQNMSGRTPDDKELSALMAAAGIKSDKDVFWAFMYKGKTTFIKKADARCDT